MSSEPGRGCQPRDMETVSEAVEVLREAGFAVESIGEVERDPSCTGVRCSLEVSKDNRTKRPRSAPGTDEEEEETDEGDSEEPEEPAGDEDLVIVSTGANGISKYHRDEHCAYAARLDDPRERPLSVLGDQAESCSSCCPEAQADDGEKEVERSSAETVYVTSGHKDVFHRDEECERAARSESVFERAEAQVADLDECAICGDGEGDDTVEEQDGDDEVEEVDERSSTEIVRDWVQERLAEQGEIAMSSTDISDELGVAGQAVPPAVKSLEGPDVEKREPEESWKGAIWVISDPEEGDEEEEESWPRECGECGAECKESLEYAVHRTEAHGSPQRALNKLEAGEFEEIVNEADEVRDISEATGFQLERCLRLLNVYGLEDIVGSSDVELSDLNDFEFEGVAETFEADESGAEEPDEQREATADGGAVAASSGASAGTQHHCKNCGSHVSERYAAVHAPEGEKNPRACPECDMVREGDGTVRPRRDKGGRDDG